MPSVRLFIGGLPPDIDQQWVKSRFHALSVHIPAPKAQSECRRFAYVEVPSDQVPLIMKKFHNSKFRGNQLRIEVAKPNFTEAMTNTSPDPKVGQPEANPTEVISNNDPSSCEDVVLKIRVGRKRAREALVQKTNPRHMKFDDLSDSCINNDRNSNSNRKGSRNNNNDDSRGSVKKHKQKDRRTDTGSTLNIESDLVGPVVKPVRQDFCWGSADGSSISLDLMKSPGLAQSSFLLSGKQSSSKVLNDGSDTDDDQARSEQRSESDDSSIDDQDPVAMDSDVIAACNNIEENELLHGDISHENEPQTQTDNNELSKEVREPNNIMVNRSKSMSSVEKDQEHKPEPAIWNHDRRYDPSNPESLKKWSMLNNNNRSDAVVVNDDKDKVVLVPEWESLWSRPDPNSNNNTTPGPSFTLSVPETTESSSIIEPDQHNLVDYCVKQQEHDDTILVLTTLRPAFLDRFAHRYKDTGECFLFRRTMSTADLIEACKEAKRKRTHAFKRQIKDHRQSEQHSHRPIS